LIRASWKDIDKRAAAIWLFLIAAAIGCQEPVGLVSGTVTYEGQPLPAGDVLFSPEDASVVPAYGTLDEAGHYHLTRAKNKPGAAPAKYRVTVQIDARENSVVARKYSIPAMYSDPSKTPLQVEVQQGENRYNIDLSR
jgi:hypothetical protein